MVEKKHDGLIFLWFGGKIENWMSSGISRFLGLGHKPIVIHVMGFFQGKLNIEQLNIAHFIELFLEWNNGRPLGVRMMGVQELSGPHELGVTH